MSELEAGTVNGVWARVLVEELARLGVREVCVAPGSRSTPLVLAASAEERLRIRVHLDERCAAFFALGVGRATGRPAAVITTSGTAVANLFPAVVEASAAEVPLLLLTADRPPRMRGSDANQAIDQVRIFGNYVRAFHELAAASVAPRDVRHLRAQAARSVAEAVGAPAGPVHLNVPFAKPLEPLAGTAIPSPRDVVPDAYRDAGPDDAAVRITVRRATLGPAEADALVERLVAAERGVLVAGPASEPVAVGEAAVRLAGATGIPLLADPLSGARWRDPRGATVLGAYDLFLDVPHVRGALRPDLVLRVGGAPTSTRLQAWLEEHADVHQVILDPGDRWKDHAVTARTYVRADPATALAELASRVRALGADTPGDGSWAARWRRMEEDVLVAARGCDAFGPGHEGEVLAATAAAMRPGEELFVGSSMPVRDLDAFGAAGARDEPLLVRGNRGASGIDGTVSTALGVAAGTGRRVVAVLGDIAFHHDMNGLLATREEGVSVVFVVIHNDGGGIFHMLPVRDREPEFTPLFATPHGLDFRHAAALYGLPYTRVDDPAHFAGALADALDGEGCRVIDVRTDRDENEARHRGVRDAVRAALTQKLEKENET